MNESRLIELETKLAYQEDTLLKLNDIVCKQQQQIQKLEDTNRLLIERFREVTATIDKEEPSDQIPPHY